MPLLLAGLKGMFKYVAAFERRRENNFPWENKGPRAKNLTEQGWGKI